MNLKKFFWNVIIDYRPTICPHCGKDTREKPT